MRDKLPKKSYRIECGIINLDVSIGPDMHYVACNKNIFKL